MNPNCIGLPTCKKISQQDEKLFERAMAIHSDTLGCWETAHRSKEDQNLVQARTINFKSEPPAIQYGSKCIVNACPLELFEILQNAPFHQQTHEKENDAWYTTWVLSNKYLKTVFYEKTDSEKWKTHSFCKYKVFPLPVSPSKSVPYLDYLVSLITASLLVAVCHA